MTWYVRLSGKIVGWVIAASHKDAIAAARAKYPGWDMEMPEVELRSRKRLTGYRRSVTLLSS